jgi:glutamate/tyrosine decarboxylase-like PLP-dependent enzyme
MITLIEEVIEYSVRTDHPFFMNQMFGKTQSISFLADIIIALLNTSMYTYEVAPVFSLIEKETIANLGARVWGKGKGDGVFTAGGSISNMNALFVARQNYQEKLKQTGLFGEKSFAIFVSDQAHYSFTKGVNFLGFGVDSLIKIQSNEDATINVDSLQKAIVKAKDNNKTPLMLVGIAGTTISGTFDPLEQLASIAKEHNMWYHVDAAFGGSLLFCEKEKPILKGIKEADSVSWNFHKVMGMSLSTSSFLTKEKGVLNSAFNVDAGYLFHEDDYDFDLGQKSLRGGRRPDAFKLWLHWKHQGDLGFAEHIIKLRDAAVFMARTVIKTKELTLYQKPQSSIVLFRYIKEGMSLQETNSLNINIRETLFKEGKLIFNYSKIHGKIYIRCVILDPKITHKQLQHLINTVVVTGTELSK